MVIWKKMCYNNNGFVPVENGRIHMYKCMMNTAGDLTYK